jgi:molecular chaperone GrpE
MKHEKPNPEDAGFPAEARGATAADNAAGKPQAMAGQTSQAAQATDAAQADRIDEALAEAAANTQPQDCLEELQAELAAATARELRAHAELENFRKRANRLLDEERKYAPLPLLRDLLPIVDNLERAIQSAAQDGGAAGLLEGVKMVRQQLTTVLAQHHCQQIEAEGAVFDPHLHEAIAQFPTDQAPPGTVVEVTLPGYRLHDRVVRPSQVLVSSRPADNATATT